MVEDEWVKGDEMGMRGLREVRARDRVGGARWKGRVTFMNILLYLWGGKMKEERGEGGGGYKS